MRSRISTCRVWKMEAASPASIPGWGEKLGKVLHVSGAAAGDDGNGNPGGQRVQHFQVKAVFHAVGVDGVEDDFARALPDTPDGPLQGINAGILPAALGKDPELAVHPLDVHGEDDALVAVFLGCRADQRGIGNGTGVDGDLVGAALEHPVKIRRGADAAAHCQGNEDFRATARRMSVNKARPSAEAVMS